RSSPRPRRRFASSSGRRLPLRPGSANPWRRTVPDDSSGCSVTIPAVRGDLEWGTLPGLLIAAAERFGEAEAVVDGDVTLSFRQLHAAGREAARAFVA